MSNNFDSAIEQSFNKLENKIRKIAIERLMTIITVCMAIVFAADTLISLYTGGAAPSINSFLVFNRTLIFKGQVWRILSFIIAYPISSNVFFTLLALYFFWWTGSAVEGYFGKARFNLYYFFGIILTIIAGFITGAANNTYLNLSLFLAFATTFPEQKVLLFFFFPIKVKWIGIAEAALLLLSLIVAIIFLDFITISVILAAIVNYFIFFGNDLINNTKRAYREYKWRKNNYNGW